MHEQVQHFITAMDELKLLTKDVDALHPRIADLFESLSHVPLLPPDHVSKAKVQTWLRTLSSMRAHDQLSDEQARQMLFDLDLGYSAFHKFVEAR